MAKRMLIDAAHPEEVRVALVDGARLDDYDFEIEGRRQLKGNIYLAKVTRVEPSLQAAFVEYGGNRHGFLPFSEIHPDYYKLPAEDMRALKEAQEAANAAAAEAARRREEEAERRAELEERAENGEDVEAELEELGGDDFDEVVKTPRPEIREYKIQEVIKRKQIMLIQVSKEERGQKGAALTTYLSLAGRYCVLMPNSPRGGGISRKISNPADRKRLKQTLGSLKMPKGMSVILRTAGLNRTKAEIRRDHEYLMRLWENIRNLTMDSHAPSLIYEEGDLIKRSIRDVYTKEFDEVLVAGEEAYRQTKDFMRLLMPSHAKKVQKYQDDGIPLFYRYQVEPQIDAIHKPVVQLKSGGYLVINPTEALISIDVNSGRATRERHIEDTAFNTNMEAAEEVARQLRLRDLAGLVVIDFIDMEDRGNNLKVERKLKDSLRRDRARIQVGRISNFGLLEMSRQRLRPSILESSYEPCPHCAGTGHLRSVDGSALHVLRALDEEGMRRRTAAMTVHMPTDVALYILNAKRRDLTNMEERWQYEVTIERDDTLVRPDFRIDRTLTRTEEEAAAAQAAAASGAHVIAGTASDMPAIKEKKSEEKKAKKDEKPAEKEAKSRKDDVPEVVTEAAEDEKKPRRRRRRRGGRGRNKAEATETVEAAEKVEAAEAVDDQPEAETKADSTEDKTESKKAKKPARRRSAKKADQADQAEDEAKAETAAEDTAEADAKADAALQEASSDDDGEDKPRRRRRGRRGGRRRSRRSEDTDNQSDDAGKEVEAVAGDSSGKAEAGGQEEDNTPASGDDRTETTAFATAELAEDEKPAAQAAEALRPARRPRSGPEVVDAKPKRTRSRHSTRTIAPDAVDELEEDAEAAANLRAIEEISDEEALEQIWAATATQRGEANDLPGPAAADGPAMAADPILDDSDDGYADDYADTLEADDLDDDYADEDEAYDDDAVMADDDSTDDPGMFDPFGTPPVRGDSDDGYDDEGFDEDSFDDDELSDDAPALTAAEAEADDDGDEGEDGEMPDWAPTDPAELAQVSAENSDGDNRKKGWWQKLMDN